MTRTRQVQHAVEDYFLRGPEKKNVKTYFTVAGGGQGAAGQNTGQAFLNLADYDKRKGSKNSADAIVAASFGGVPRACATPRFSRWFRARSAGSASRAASRWRCSTPAA